ncbi:retrotransposon protein, partial [Trifolium medium]|nr:retrotransposon protein [Trifolium medium]
EAVYQQRRESEKARQQLKVKNPPNKGKHIYSPQIIKPCLKCGNRHRDECLKGRGICYSCKQPGHMRNYCPKWESLSGIEGSTNGKGHVYTMDGTSE